MMFRLGETSPFVAEAFSRRATHLSIRKVQSAHVKGVFSAEVTLSVERMKVLSAS
jgi:hypothetical protein